jgi:hypothetical protein
MHVQRGLKGHACRGVECGKEPLELLIPLPPVIIIIIIIIMFGYRRQTSPRLTAHVALFGAAEETAAALLLREFTHVVVTGMEMKKAEQGGWGA